MSETADLLRAIASLLWVAIGIAVVVLLARVILARSDQLRSIGIGPSGLSVEFVQAKVDQAIQTAQPAGVQVGQAARRSVVERLQRHADLLAEARILWVDDHPENNEPILELLRRFGAVVETPLTNTEALALLSTARYDVIISDVARDDEGPTSHIKGVELAQEVYARWSQQILLFTARFNPATMPNMSAEERLQLVERVRRTVFASTNRMDLAVHYILDILER